MKSVGIVRKIDELGRIVLPKELRNSNNIFPGDDFEIYIDENKIILEKYGKYLSKIEKLKSVFCNEKILFIINDEIINSGEKVSPSINKLIHERKYIVIKSNCELSNKINLTPGSIVYPLVSDSNIIGTLIFNGVIGLNDISKLLINVFNLL